MCRGACPPERCKAFCSKSSSSNLVACAAAACCSGSGIWKLGLAPCRMSLGVQSRGSVEVAPVSAALAGSALASLVCAAKPVPAVGAPPPSACSLSPTGITPAEGASGGCLLPETPSSQLEDSCRVGAGRSWAPSSGDKANGTSASVAGCDGASASLAIASSLSLAMLAGVSSEPVVSNVPPSSLMASPPLPLSPPRLGQYSGSSGEFSGSPGDCPASRTGTSLMSARNVPSCSI